MARNNRKSNSTPKASAKKGASRAPRTGRTAAAQGGGKAAGAVKQAETRTTAKPKPTARGRGVPEPVIMLTHNQIADRAYAIWRAKGCAPGQDEQNWREAERQLRKELSIA